HAYRKGAHFYISGLRFFYSNIIFASVPFPFDVHAIIFSEDAPALENALHKIFHNKRVNKVNNRKEFFRVSLKENEHVVRESYNKPVEFLKLGTAQEYRETMMIEKEESKIYSSSLLTVS
ncbi:GIY-YIG nuclease family protein, partial [Niallia endozanthoxylica]